MRDNISLSVRIKIKYGLPTEPDNDSIVRWRREVTRLLGEGVEPEIAGADAANSIFSGVGTWFYRSQADDIEVLLAAAAER